MDDTAQQTLDEVVNSSPIKRYGMVSVSQAMQMVYDAIEQLAPLNSNVLIIGETGVGKNLVAEAIHKLSKRKGELFIFDCPSIAKSTFESEIFGHRKGAYTGAEENREGIFEYAQQGTVLLDEISEIPILLQSKLLGVVERRVVTRMGEHKSRQVDVRIVAATNRDLQKGFSEGEFRRDLYYRLSVSTIRVPPLRERREDIAPLIGYYLNLFQLANNRIVPPFKTEEYKAYTSDYHWPGNVRELRNAIEDMVITGKDKLDKLEEIKGNLSSLNSSGAATTGSSDVYDSSYRFLRAENMDLFKFDYLMQKQLMERALQETGGIQTEAAKLLGLSFRQFRYKRIIFGVKIPLR